MSCDRELQRTAYLDGELDLTGTLDFEAHVAGCAECARALDAGRALRQAIADADLRYRPSAAQRRRWAAAAGGRVWGTGVPLLRPYQLRTLAALVLVAIAAYTVGRRWPAPSPVTASPEAALTAEQLVGSHVRALLAGRPEDVESSGRHVIKPWFAGRLDFTPPIVDLTDSGIPLRGARLDFIAGRPVATLIYLVGTHLVSVSIWPLSADAPGGIPPPGATVAGTHRGFEIRHWSQASMNWWVVSDASAKGTDQLVAMLRAALPR
jgi:anti-sigma factor RsiW